VSAMDLLDGFFFDNWAYYSTVAPDLVGFCQAVPKVTCCGFGIFLNAQIGNVRVTYFCCCLLMDIAVHWRLGGVASRLSNGSSAIC